MTAKYSKMWAPERLASRQFCFYWLPLQLGVLRFPLCLREEFCIPIFLLMDSQLYSTIHILEGSLSHVSPLGGCERALICWRLLLTVLKAHSYSFSFGDHRRLSLYVHGILSLSSLLNLCCEFIHFLWAYEVLLVCSWLIKLFLSSYRPTSVRSPCWRSGIFLACVLCIQKAIMFV